MENYVKISIKDYDNLKEKEKELECIKNNLNDNNWVEIGVGMLKGYRYNITNEKLRDSFKRLQNDYENKLEELSKKNNKKWYNLF